MWSWLQSWLQRGDEREFEVLIYEEDYKELCAFVLRKPNIETGGDLLGLWANDHKAVIQLTLGPGKGRRRTSTSFYQDVKYLENVGSYLTENEGVCHIGEWHSHHQLDLARPSGGDENTVWNKMPTYNLSRFVIFIANIEASKQTYTVNIGCFLFEIDKKGNRLPVKEGKFKILHAENPFSQKKEVKKKRSEGAEHEGGDEGNIDIKDLKLVEREGDRPYVTFKRPIKRILRDDDYQSKTKKNKSKKQTTIRGEDTVKNPERGEGSTCAKETADPGNRESRDLSQEIHQEKSDQEDSDTSHEEAANEKPGEGTAGATEAAKKDKDDGEDGKKENKREKEMMGEGSMEKEKDDGQDGKEGNKRKNEMMGEEGKKTEKEEEEEKQQKMKEKQEGQENPEKKATSKGEQKSKGKPAASAPARETSTAVSGVEQEATTSATGKSKNKAQTKKKENTKAEKAAQPTKGKKDVSKTPGGAKKAK